MPLMATPKLRPLSAVVSWPASTKTTPSRCPSFCLYSCNILKAAKYILIKINPGELYEKFRRISATI